MPELKQNCIPSPAPPPIPPGIPPIPPEVDPPAMPPVINPGEWENFAVFRESFLIYISEPEFNAALRTTAEYLFGMLLECCPDWPAWSESSTRTEMRALVADLRHAQGFAASIGQERTMSSLSPSDVKLSRHASRVARLLKQVADTMERKLEKSS